MSGNATIQWPFGPADEQAKAAAGAVAIEVSNRKTVVTIAQLDAGCTVSVGNATGHEAKAGDELIIKTSADGSGQNLIFGTGITGVTIAINASKTQVVKAVHDGSGWVVESTIQID